MTTVVVYDEFKKVTATISGGERDGEEKNEMLAGAQRAFTLAPGETITITGVEPAKEGDNREDGPTVAEWVAAGKLARDYPPAGCVSRSSDEEIQASIAAQDKQKAPTGLNVEQVPPSFTPAPDAPNPWPAAVPTPQETALKDPRNEEQKAADADRAATGFTPAPVVNQEPPKEPTGHDVLPGQVPADTPVDETTTDKKTE